MLDLLTSKGILVKLLGKMFYFTIYPTNIL